MPRAKNLVSVQVGNESTWGTAVAQTAIVPNLTEFNVKPNITINRRRAGLGNLAMGGAATVTRADGSATMEGYPSYGVLGLWLENLFGAATDAGAGPYTHTHDPDTSAAITRKFYTLMKSDSTDAASLTGGLITEYTLSLSAGEEPTESITWVGKMVADGTITGSLADFTDGDQPILASELTVYLDPVGSAGSTSLACAVKSLDLTLSAETVLTYGVGNTAACNYVTTGYDASVTMTAEADNATVKTYVENLLGSSPTATHLVLQLSFSKSANYAWTLILPCVLTEAPEWHADTDGVITFDMSFGLLKEATATDTTNTVLNSVLTNQDADI